MNTLIASRFLPWTWILPMRIPTTLRRLRDVCVQDQASCHPSSLIEFYGMPVSDQVRMRSVYKNALFLTWRARGLQTLRDQEIVAALESSLRRIGLETENARQLAGPAALYEIPVQGVWWTRYADITLRPSSKDSRVTLCRIELTRD